MAEGTVDGEDWVFVSPDQTVVVRHRRHRNVEVSFTPRRRVSHSDKSLAVQVGLAIKDMLDVYVTAQTSPLETCDEDEETAAHRRRHIDRELAAITVSQTSPHGYVTVVLHAAEDPQVLITQQSLHSRGSPEIFAEINRALNQALLEYQRRMLLVHKDAHVNLRQPAAA